MTGFGSSRPHGRIWRWLTAAIFIAAGWSAGFAAAQTPTGVSTFLTAEPAPAKLPGTVAPVAAAMTSDAKTDPNVIPAGCSKCAGGLLGGTSDDMDGYGCACGDAERVDVCIPGRLHCCSCCDASGPIGRCLCGIYNCICCPDPCYESHWIAAANASFWLDSVRPQTQMGVRWEHATDFGFPDKAEIFYKKSGTGGPPATKKLGYDQIGLYTEAGAGLAGMFIYVPYLEVHPDAQQEHSGFGDLIIGTKSVLLDCELLQVGFMFKTYVPVGNTTEGLGTGHLTLEPTLLATCKLGPNTYLQAQLGEWIPIAGTSGFAGGNLNYHLSLNHLLYKILPDVVLIGTLEFNGWSFQNGAFSVTDGKNVTVFGAADTTYANIGPGIRLVICDKADIGVGSAFAITSARGGPESVFRTEFRWRF
jgi:hypothetical protein